MAQFFSVLQIIVPIFVTVALGAGARKKQSLTPEQVQGLSRFVTKFCLPCVLFNSCLTAAMELQSLTAMACAAVSVLGGTLLSFRMRRRLAPYHNLPMMFCAQESGMLGIPLYLALFGAPFMFRMGVLDVAQSFVAIPVIALLGAVSEEDTSLSKILASVLRSPLLIASLCGLTLNFSGIMSRLNALGCGEILAQTTSFIAQPVSAVMLFCVGYNFSLKGSRKVIFRLSVIHFGYYVLCGAAMLLCLSFTSQVTPHTLWAAVLYCTLPPSYLSPGFSRTEEEATVSAGACSILTIVSLVVFCIAAIATAA